MQSAKLCEQKTHTSSISDTDHWFLGGDGHGYPSDTVTYSWSKTAGTNPQTGTFIGDTDKASVVWKAPPCTGTVNIKLTANDKPDSMDNPCPGSTRNDSSKDFEGTSAVSLPTGCSTGTKSAIFAASKAAPTGCGHPIKPCGATSSPRNFEILIYARYNNCKWSFEVLAGAEVPCGPCPSNYTNVTGGGDVSEENYCAIVDDFNNDNGCVSVGGTNYSNTQCTTIHEDEHYEMFEERLVIRYMEFLTKPSMSDMTIDCGDPDTTTCQAAVAVREVAITVDVVTAYISAFNDMEAMGEGRPEDAARPCFTNIANSICDYGQSQGWESCEHCD